MSWKVNAIWGVTHGVGFVFLQKMQKTVFFMPSENRKTANWNIKYGYFLNAEFNAGSENGRKIGGSNLKIES